MNFFYRKCTTKPLLLKKKDFTPKKIFIRFPFLGAISVQIRNELKFFLYKYTDDKASVYIIDALSRILENFRFKDKQPLLMKSGISYYANLHAHVDLLILVRLGVTYLVGIKNMLF